MKPKNRTRLPLFAFAVLSFIGSDMARAASQTYDATNLSNVWDTTTTNWDSSTAAWTNGNDAIFAGTNEAVAVTTVTAHNLDFNTTGYSLTGSSITLNGATPTLTAGTGISASITSIIAGSAGLKKDGAGTVILTGSNIYTGGNTVNAGTLQIGNGVANGSYNGAYSITGGATLRSARATAAAPPWSSISGAGTLALNSAQAINGSANWGTAALGAGFTGKLFIENGRVDSNVTALGGTTSMQIGSGGQLLMYPTTGVNYTLPVTIAGNGWGEGGHPGALRGAVATCTWSGPITLSANAGIYSQTGTFTITGSISGAFECEFTRNGNITVAPAAAVQNSYASTKISSAGSGVISAGNQYAFSTGGLLMNGGVLALNNNSFSFANLSGNTGVIENNGTTTASVITVGSDNTSTSYGGTLVNGNSATLGLTKTGTGALTLAGANTYTGATNVNNGSLLLNAGTLNASSAVTVANGTTFGGKGTAGAVSVAAGGVVQGGLANAGSLALSSLSFAGSSTLNLMPVTGLTASVAVAGAVTTSGTQTLNITSPPLETGSYRLLSYGSVGGAGLGAFVLGSTPTVPGARPRVYTLDTAPATYVGLNVLADFPIWTGGTSGVWDTSATGNWKLASDGITPTTYFTADAVQFNDTAGIRNLTLSGTDVTPLSATFNNSTGNDYTLSGSNGIAGSASLTKINTGKLTIINTNSYTGGTTVSGGILQLGDGTTNGAIAGNIVNNANVTFNNGSAQTYSGIISGAGGTFTKTGPGTLTLTGANSYGGGTTVNAGILQIGSGAVNGTIGTGAYSIAGGAGLYLNYATAAGPTWANITGAGVLELNSAQAVNGSANWGAPALPAGMIGTLKVDKGRINGVPANFGGATNVAIGDGAQFLAYDGTNAGTAYNYTQNFSLNGMGWGESGHNLGAVRVSGMNATLSGNVTLTGNSGLYTQSASANSSLSLTGVIADGGGGYGLTINAGGNPITLGGANTYGGNTVISIGTLKLGAADVIPDGAGKGNVVVTGTLDLNAFNETINGLSGAGTIDTLTGGTPVLTVGNNNQSGTFSGIIRNTTGTLALTKVGSGTLNLTGSNTYQGDTTVSGGTLNVATAPTILGNYQVQSGGTLGVTLNTAPSLIANNVVLENGSTLSLPIGEYAALNPLDVSTTGTVTIQPRNILSTGTFPLILCDSQTSPLPVFTLGSLPRGVVASLNVTSSQTDLVVSAINPLLWKGNNGPAWDTNVTTNWTLSGSPDKFQVGDNVRFDDSASGAGTVPVTLAADVNPVTVEFANNTRNYTLSGAGGIAGTGGLIKSGSGKLTVTNTNSYSGGTTVSGGILQLGDGTTNGVIAGNIIDTANVTFNNGTAQSYSGVISGDGGTVTKTGAGNFTLTATNTYNGGTTLDGGTLTIGSNSALGTGDVTFDGGTLAVSSSGSRNITNGLVIGAGGGTITHTTSGQNFSFTGGTLTGSGTLAATSVSTGSQSRLLFNGIDTSGFTGTIVVTGTNVVGEGLYFYGGTTDIGAGIKLNVGSGAYATVQFATANIGELSGTAPEAILTSDGGNSNYVIGALNTDSSYAGRITNYYAGPSVVSVTKTGTGKLTLSGASTYTGATTVNSGALLVDGSLAAASAVTVNSGATLGGSGVVNGTVTAAGSIAPGGSAVGILTTGNTALTGTLTCQISGATADRLVAGTLDITGATLAVSELVPASASSYQIATYTGSLVGTFASVPSGYTVDYGTTGQILLLKTGTSGYASWAASFPGIGDPAATADPDHDGISNLMEYVIGGDPRVSSASFLPSQAIVGPNLVLSYKRSDASEADTTQVGQWSADLVTWHNVTPVLVNENSSAPDDMTISIPLTNAANGKLFGRLNVAKP